MLKSHYPSEMSVYTDQLTGRVVTQLTDSRDWNNVHLYFTENAFTRGGRDIYFLSDRDTPDVMNVFSADELTGDIKRHTAFTDISVTNLTKDPGSRYLLYYHGNDAILHATETGTQCVFYRVPEGFRPGRLSLNCDQTLIGCLVNEDAGVEHGKNYAGFAEKMYRVKRSRIDLVPLTDGRPGEPECVMRDTHEAGHLQFSPVDRHILMYCHEGPWHLVMQRIFLMNTDTGDVYPCFRQDRDDSVGHEFWTRDGLVCYDNRGPGHDGTITSHGGQAVAVPLENSGFEPYIGFADISGNPVRTYKLPFYCNHYHGGSSNLKLAADDVEDIVAIDLRSDPPALSTLCKHGTSWYGQETHCHPTVSWSDDRVLYASDAKGKVNLYLVDWHE